MKTLDDEPSGTSCQIARQTGANQMKLHHVIGNVTLSRSHPSYQSARLLACLPLEHSTLHGQAAIEPDLVVVWDELGLAWGTK